jgi:cell division protein FtsI (penicillin-binding protein 3)
MIKSRLLLIILVIFVFFIGLIIKLIDIQIVKREELKYFALRQHLKEETILPDRGLIYDRNNILLAYNRNDYSLYIDKDQMKESKAKVAEEFSKLFGKKKSYYLELLNSSKKVVCLEKKASGEKALYLQSNKKSGIFAVNNPSRVYQYQNLGSHLLGYVDADFEGRNGIEQFWNKSLKGVEGKRIIERNGLGDITAVAENETQPAVPGNSIVLTINKNIQAILEEELNEGLKTYGGTSASGIIVDPFTGEILALANAGDYDPNNYNKYSDESRRNKAVTDTYEPGSTFKGISFASLIDQKLVKLNENIFVENGKYKFNNVYIHDSHKEDWLTVRGVFEQSSNIGIAKLIQRIDDETYYKYLRGFGFGTGTSLELPSESKGKLKNPAQWNKLTKTFISYGYEISITPIQLAMAYCALINGGTLYQPRLIKKELSPTGVVLYESLPREIRKVISSETSSVMRDLLAGAVKNGSGKYAKSDVVSIGGKTGTSQKLINGKYSKQEYNTSFAGFFPLENPKAVCVILVNSPSVGRYGGLVAAPIFKKIAEKTVISLPLEYQPPKNIDEVKDEVKFIYAKNDQESEKQETINSSLQVKPINGKMPDLTGVTVREAVQILSRIGIRHKIKGSGRIVQQSILPGEPVNNKSFCEIICDEKSNTKAVVY